MGPKQRADTLPNSPTLLQPWDALGSKLIEAAQEQTPSKRRVMGSNPSRDASGKKNRLFTCCSASFEIIAKPLEVSHYKPHDCARIERR